MTTVEKILSAMEYMRASEDLDYEKTYIPHGSFCGFSVECERFDGVNDEPYTGNSLDFEIYFQRDGEDVDCCTVYPRDKNAKQQVTEFVNMWVNDQECDEKGIELINGRVIFPEELEDAYGTIEEMMGPDMRDFIEDCADGQSQEWHNTQDDLERAEYEIRSMEDTEEEIFYKVQDELNYLEEMINKKSLGFHHAQRAIKNIRKAISPLNLDLNNEKE